MYDKKLRQICVGCAAALALTIVAGPISASAATPAAIGVTEVNKVDPGTDATGKTAKADDPVSRQALDPSVTTGALAYTDTQIDVWGYTHDATIYSVDVEWGAMTFEYEKNSWDPKEHKQIEGRGWLVYDNVAEEALTATQDAINKVTITNHSNAAVKAQLSYASVTDGGIDGNTDYTGIDGTFNKSNVTPAEDVKAEWDGRNNCFTLKTAATNENDETISDPTTTAGTPAKGNVYFLPENISDAVKTAGIEKWTTIGKITVAITTVPTSPAP